MVNLMDVGGIPDDSPLDKRIQAAMDELYETLHEIKRTSRRESRLTESGPLVFPLRGRDMRFWRTSDGRKAQSLLSDRQASRIASARKVMANPALSRYRAMTASQYLQALEEAVITDHRPENNGYKRVSVLV
jgi:hypothetical protein